MKNSISLFDKLMGTSTQKYISNATLKELVIRDLLSLLNTSSYYTDKNADINSNHSYNSVINYGIHPLSGKRASEINWQDVENNITSAIKVFEPRILSRSLEVKCLVQDENSILYNQISIEISGFIHSNPYPERFVLNTSLDLETGNFNLS